MPWKNGEIPLKELHVFNTGRTIHNVNGKKYVEDWVQATTPGTYQKHLALVALAKRNRGRTLQASPGFSFYRPLAAQDFARFLFGNGAARRGTSSHGGWWEGRETMAIDYHNWSEVYGGDRAAWYADVRAVGLTPGMISPARGYPDEPWHVIDLEPRRAVPAGGGATSFNPAPATLPEEEEMSEIISSSAGQSLMSGSLVVSFPSPADVTAALKAGLRVVEVSAAMHESIIAAANASKPTPIVLVYGDPNGSVYTWDGDGALDPVYDPSTLDRLKSLPGVVVQTWSSEEIRLRNANKSPLTS